MAFPKFAVLNRTTLVRIKEIRETKNTYSFSAEGISTPFVVKKNKDKKVRFYSKRPHRW